MPVSGVEMQLRYFLHSAAVHSTLHRVLVQKHQEDERQNKRRLAHSRRSLRSGNNLSLSVRPWPNSD